ncbi:MAG TPA: hypothetical protein VFF73_29555 [Planctomycetota bacterium]|nr:hypothetical protein [Planctomycetota bacterium]
MRRRGLTPGVLAAALAVCVSGCGSSTGHNGEPVGLSQVAGNVPGPGPQGTGPNGNPNLFQPGKQYQTIAMPSGYAEPRAIAASDLSQTLYVSALDSNENAVILSLPASGGSSSVVASGLTAPVAMALGKDQHTLYVADMAATTGDSAGEILSVATSGGSLEVVSAGAVEAPTGLAVSSDGKTLYVSGSDPVTGEGGVWSLSTAGGAAKPLATGGAITQPTGLGLSTDGQLILLADAGHGLPAAQLLSVSTGGGSAALVATIDDTLEVESGVAEKSGTIYVATRTQVAQVNGSVATTAAAGSPFAAPNGIATNGQHTYVADAQAAGAGLIVVLN